MKYIKKELDLEIKFANLDSWNFMFEMPQKEPKLYKFWGQNW